MLRPPESVDGVDRALTDFGVLMAEEAENRRQVRVIAVRSQVSERGDLDPRVISFEHPSVFGGPVDLIERG